MKTEFNNERKERQMARINPDHIYSADELAEILECKAPAVTGRIRRNTLKAAKVNGSYCIKGDDALSSYFR